MVSPVPSRGKQSHPSTSRLPHRLLFCKAACLAAGQPLLLHGVTVALTQDSTFVSAERQSFPSAHFSSLAGPSLCQSICRSSQSGMACKPAADDLCPITRVTDEDAKPHLSQCRALGNATHYLGCWLVFTPPTTTLGASWASQLSTRPTIHPSSPYFPSLAAGILLEAVSKALLNAK